MFLIRGVKGSLATQEPIDGLKAAVTGEADPARRSNWETTNEEE
jgi:hypothetical protein